MSEEERADPGGCSRSHDARFCNVNPQVCTENASQLQGGEGAREWGNAGPRDHRIFRAFMSKRSPRQLITDAEPSPCLQLRQSLSMESPELGAQVGVHSPPHAFNDD